MVSMLGTILASSTTFWKAYFGLCEKSNNSCSNTAPYKYRLGLIADLQASSAKRKVRMQRQKRVSVGLAIGSCF